MIKSFSVYGLFGTSDVHIPFDENIKILIGENGLGKTQILNMFYYTLNRRFEKLADFSFDKINIQFSNCEPIEISKQEIEDTYFNHPLSGKLIDVVGFQNFMQLKKFVNRKDSPNEYSSNFNRKMRSLISSIPMNTSTILEILRGGDSENLFSSQVKKCEEKIIDELGDTEIMYFPTFRRVEEDLKNLGYEEEEFQNDDNRLIHFGMGDVRKRFDEIENRIDKLLKEGFSKISGEILSQLVKGFSGLDANFIDRIDEKDIEIILSRVGKQLSDTDKNEIRNIVINREIKNESLVYFLQKLIEIYEKQKPLDNFIKDYIRLCNSYLINKKLFYDESQIKIYIKSDSTGEEIELSKLSSGEKQIISILSKIYLADKNQRFLVLFDEPELSLSMLWQKQLLPDIMNSKKVDFLLAVTHSPFIFDNELDKYAVGLNEYIKPIEQQAVFL